MVNVKTVLKCPPDAVERFTTQVSLEGLSVSKPHSVLVNQALQAFQLQGTNFENKHQVLSLIRNYLAQVRARFTSGIYGAGYARLLAAAHLGHRGVMHNFIEGYDHLKTVASFADTYRDDPTAAFDRIAHLANQIVARDKLIICIPRGSKMDRGWQDAFRNAVDSLPARQIEQVPSGWTEPPVHEPDFNAILTTLPTTFNAKVFRTVPFIHTDAPALMVLAGYLSIHELYREVCEDGGAYASSASYHPEFGQFSFTSYRDPNITRTFSAFDTSVQRVIERNIAHQDLNAAILYAYRSLTSVVDDQTSARNRYLSGARGYSTEMRDEFVRRILAVQQSDLKRVASVYLSGNGAVATLANEQKLNKASKEMPDIFKVRNNSHGSK